MLKQLDYSLSISTRDSCFGLHPGQLSRDRDLELIIQLFNRKSISVLIKLVFPVEEDLTIRRTLVR